MPRKKKTDDGQTTDGTQTTAWSSSTQNDQNIVEDIILDTSDIEQSTTDLEIDLSLPQEEKSEEVSLDIGEIQIEEPKQATESISDLWDVLMEENYEKLDGTYWLNEDFSFDLSIDENNSTQEENTIIAEDEQITTENITLDTNSTDNIDEISLNINEEQTLTDLNNIELNIEEQKVSETINMNAETSEISFETIAPVTLEIDTNETIESSDVIWIVEDKVEEESQIVSYDVEESIIAQESSETINNLSEENQEEISWISIDIETTQPVEIKNEEVQDLNTFDLDTIDTKPYIQNENIVELNNIEVSQSQPTSINQETAFDLDTITANQMNMLEDKVEQIEQKTAQEEISTIDTSNLVNTSPKTSKKWIFVWFMSILWIILLWWVWLWVYVVMYPDNNIFNTKSQNVEIPESLITADNSHSAAENIPQEENNVETVDNEDTWVYTWDNSNEWDTTLSWQDEQLSWNSISSDNQGDTETESSTWDNTLQENSDETQQPETTNEDVNQLATWNNEESEISSWDSESVIIDETKKDEIKQLALKAKKSYLSAKQIDNKDAMKYSLIVYKNSKKIYDSIINNETLDPVKLESNIKTLETYLEKTDKLLNE